MCTSNPHRAFHRPPHRPTLPVAPPMVLCFSSLCSVHSSRASDLIHNKRPVRPLISPRVVAPPKSLPLHWPFHSIVHRPSRAPPENSLDRFSPLFLNLQSLICRPSSHHSSNVAPRSYSMPMMVMWCDSMPMVVMKVGGVSVRTPPWWHVVGWHVRESAWWHLHEGIFKGREHPCGGGGRVRLG